LNRVLSRWNLLAPDEAAREILACCGSEAWAKGLTGRRPIEDAATLLALSDRVWVGLSAKDWLQAFQNHPRIGDGRQAGNSSDRSATWSAQEQGHASEADNSLKARLAQGNLAYEERFKRIFIICATEKSASEILENLKCRLQNDEVTELQETAEQQRQIIQLRLRKWLAE
jgi:2-oxo-4-hydroxy-4-carboxy-5-ureidoimidazoline decarboxylase